MNKLYAVQWLSDDDKWEVCQIFDHQGKESAAVYFNLEDAEIEAEDWKDSTGDANRYRVYEVEV